MFEDQREIRLQDKQDPTLLTDVGVIQKNDEGTLQEGHGERTWRYRHKRRLRDLLRRPSLSPPQNPSQPLAKISRGEPALRHGRVLRMGLVSGPRAHRSRTKICCKTNRYSTRRAGRLNPGDPWDIQEDFTKITARTLVATSGSRRSTST